MRNRILWLRACYWFGAIADAIVAIGMVYPPLLRPVLGLPETIMSVGTRYALGLGASLMLGWTCLLLWANAKPVERRGVLILSVVPVILGLALTTLYGLASGYIPLRGAVSVWVFQFFAVSAFLLAYFFAPVQG